MKDQNWSRKMWYSANLFLWAVLCHWLGLKHLPLHLFCFPRSTAEWRGGGKLGGKSSDEKASHKEFYQNRKNILLSSLFFKFLRVFSLDANKNSCGSCSHSKISKNIFNETILCVVFLYKKCADLSITKLVRTNLVHANFIWRIVLVPDHKFFTQRFFHVPKSASPNSLSPKHF